MTAPDVPSDLRVAGNVFTAHGVALVAGTLALSAYKSPAADELIIVTAARVIGRFGHVEPHGLSAAPGWIVRYLEREVLLTEQGAVRRSR